MSSLGPPGKGPDDKSIGGSLGSSIALGTGISDGDGMGGVCDGSGGSIDTAGLDGLIGDGPTGDGLGVSLGPPGIGNVDWLIIGILSVGEYEV